MPEVSHSVVRLSVVRRRGGRQRPTERAIAVALQLAVRAHAGRMCDSEPEPRKSSLRSEDID